MFKILCKDHKLALDYLQDWYSLNPDKSFVGLGEEMYHLLREEFCMELPELPEETLGIINTSVEEALRQGLTFKWSCDYIFTTLEDEGLLKIYKW